MSAEYILWHNMAELYEGCTSRRTHTFPNGWRVNATQVRLADRNVWQLCVWKADQDPQSCEMEMEEHDTLYNLNLALRAVAERDTKASEMYAEG